MWMVGLACDYLGKVNRFGLVCVYTSLLTSLCESLTKPFVED